jgi:hypothetical protein
MTITNKIKIYSDDNFDVNMFEDFGTITLEKTDLKSKNKVIYPTDFIYNKSLNQRVLKQFFLNHLRYYTSNVEVNKSYESLTFIQLIELYKKS